MLVKITAFDDNENEFEMWIDPFAIKFIIPAENAVRIDGSFIKVTKESLDILYDKLK